MLSGEELLRRGREAAWGGQIAAAKQLLRRALRRSEDPELTARIELSLAYVVGESGDPEAAELVCRRIISAHLSDRVAGIGWSQLGLLRLRVGDLVEADTCFARAIAVLEDSADLGVASLNAGNLSLQRGELAQAEAHFGRAETQFRAQGLAVNEAKAGHNLAYVRFLLGDLPEALRGMESYYAFLSSQGPVLRAVCEQDRAEVLLAAGLVTQARSALTEAAKALGSRGLPQFQGECELVLARTMLGDDPRAAGRVARRAARRFADRGSQTWALRAHALASMARIDQAGRATPTVDEVDHLTQQLRQAQLHNEAAQLRIYATRLLLRRHRHDEAVRRLRTLRLPESASIATRLLLHQIRADLEQAGQRPSRAVPHVRKGLAELHAWQSSFGSMDLQSGLVGHGRELASTGMRLALADGRPALVFEWSERGRALVNRVAPVRPPEDPQVAAELAELRFLSAQRPDPRSAEGRRLAQVKEHIRQHAWYGRGSGQVTEPIALAEIQDELRADDAALVAYLGLDKQLTALVVTGDRAAVVPLGSLGPIERLLESVHADLDMAATNLPDSLREVVIDSGFRTLGLLGEHLVAPIRHLIGDRRLVLTPSTVVARTPWTLLPGFEGRPLTVPQSATRWLRMHRSPTVSASAAQIGFVAGPGVDWAEPELKVALSMWGRGELLLGPAATVSAAKEVAERADVLHFAAHGRHATDNAMFSGLELADGTFFGYDIGRIRRVPDTVLLSACEVGRGTAVSGEETVGMTAAWLHAGVGSVIASCALIGDLAAEDVLVRVHAQLTRGADPASALAAAQAESDALAPLICFGSGW